MPYIRSIDKKRLSLFIVALMLIGINLSAQVDSIRFNTGDYMLGEVKSMQKGILQMETDYSDSDFMIEWKKTTEIYSESQFLINLSNGKKYFGRLRSQSDSIVRIITIENETLEVRNEDIVYLNAYDEKFLDRFSASISLGLDMAKTRNLQQFVTRSSLGYKADKWNSTASFFNLRSTQDETEDIHRTEADLNFSYILPWRLYGIASLSYLSNTEQNIKSRINAQIGVGRYLVITNSLDWRVKLGANRNIERYTDNTDDKESWEGYMGTDFNIFDLGDLDLLFSIITYPSITEAGRWRSDIKFDVKYELPLDFFIKTGISVNYDNQPAGGASTTDYVFNIGFGWEW